MSTLNCPLKYTHANPEYWACDQKHCSWWDTKRQSCAVLALTHRGVPTASPDEGEHYLTHQEASTLAQQGAEEVKP